MPLFSFEGLEPRVSDGAWIAPTATLVGDVRVEDGASVWYGAVLRADFGPIIVRRGANIQDGSVLHGGAVADQRLRADPGAVHHAQVADGGALADLAGRVAAAVQHRAVLDVGAAPDDDRPEVGAQHRAVPDRGLGLHRDVPDQGGGGSDPCFGADPRRAAFKGEQWHPEGP